MFDAATGRAIVFNGTGPAPATATPERYAGDIPRIGPLSVSVPGMLSALDRMHRRFGQLPWRHLFEEAIGYARDGFGATRAYCHFAEEYRPTLMVDPAAAGLFLTDGQPPALGAAIVQPELARTLEEIATDGAETFTAAGSRDGLRLASKLPVRWSGMAISPSLSPRNNGRSRSITAVTPFSKRRPIQPGSCCSRN